MSSPFWHSVINLVNERITISNSNMNLPCAIQDFLLSTCRQYWKHGGQEKVFEDCCISLSKIHLSLNPTWCQLNKCSDLTHCLKLSNLQAVIKGHNPLQLLWMSILEGPLMLEMNLIVVDTIYPQSTKFVSKVKFKATGKINNNK